MIAERGLIDFMRFIELSNRCATQAELVELFNRTLGELGFDKFVYSLMRGSAQWNGRPHHGIARSYPESWMKHYLANNYLEADPTYRRALRQRGVFAWREVMTAEPLARREKRVMLEAAEAGLQSGVSLSIYGPLGEVMGFGFASDTPNLIINRDQQSLLHALANQFHLAYMALDATSPPAAPAAPVRLTDRQRAILQLAAAGKNRAEIAEILGISIETVKDHFSGIFQKLNCHNQAAATAKAITLGLIQY